MNVKILLSSGDTVEYEDAHEVIVDDLGDLLVVSLPDDEEEVDTRLFNGPTPGHVKRTYVVRGATVTDVFKLYARIARGMWMMYELEH